MDKVLNDIVDEVALEGDQGCTVDKLFTLVETLLTKALKDTPLSHPILFDDRYKSYLWQQIKHNSQLLFIENEEAIDPNDLTYGQLKSKNILVKTTEHVLDRNIYGSLKDVKKSLNEKQRHILNNIAKSRNQGISQYELGELFHMDSKTIFYHVKKLDQLGLIVKEDAYASRMFTKLLFLKRFASQPSSEDNKEQQNEGVIYRLPVFKEKINKILEQQANHIMPIADLLVALSLNGTTEKKWARVRIQEMHEQGEIEKFNATDGKRLRQCVRLKSMSTATSTSGTFNVFQEDAVQPSKPFAMDRDLPCDYVFYRDIEAAAGKGLTRQDLIDKYPFIDPVQTKIFSDSATFPPKTSDLMPYLLHCTEEVSGRARQFRFYTQNGWRAFNEANGTQIAEEPISTIAPKHGEPEILREPTSIDEISRVLKEPARKRTHYSKERYQARKEAAAKKRKTTADDTPASTPASTPVSTPASTPPPDNAEEPPSQIPSKRANDETNDKPVSLTTKKRGKKDSVRNITKTRRCGIILDMVEKVHIREFNTDMMSEFRSIELETHDGQKMARKTFDDLVKELHDQQKLKIYVTAIKKPNGLTDIKKFVLHSSLSGDSPQVKEFIGHYHVQKPIMDGPSARKEIKAVTMPALPHSSHFVDKSAMAIVGNSNSWRVNAIENGWVPSKWIRAKVLHVSLFQYMASKDIQDGMVDMIDYLRWIQLRTVMKIFSVLPYDDPVLKAFLDVEENRDTAICDLPANIKGIVSQAASRIRVRIVRLIHVLYALSLIEVEEGAMNGYSIPSKIQLLKQGLIRDYATPGHPLRFTLQLNNISDVQLYWRDLQRCCMEKRMKSDTIHDENDILYNIVLPRLWRPNTLLSKEQKVILDSFIDFDAKTVPADDDRTLRIHIARKTDLPLKRIQAYYKSMLMAFKKYSSRKEKEEQKAAKKEQSLKASPAIAELMQASMEKRKINAAMFKMKQHGPFVQATFVASRKLRRLRIPLQSDDAQKRQTKNVDDHLVSDVEKDVMIYAYSIMKARADTSLFYWSPIAKVITSCTPDKSRRTIDYITRLNPRLLDTINRLKADWKDIYQEGIAKGEIKDDAPWDTQDYDLPGFLEYFILKLQERERQADAVVPLPRQLSEFDSRFSIVRDGNPTSAADNYHQVTAYTHCFDEHEYDISTNSINQFDEQKVSVYLVMILIKMMFITPDDKYCTNDAYMLLREYPEDVIEQAVDHLTAMGMLIRGRADFGRIPGRGINVSEKFLIVAAGILPYEFFKQAREFYATLVSRAFIDLEASHINSGTVAAILDLISQGKISIGLQDADTYIKPKKSTYYPKASAAALRKAYVYKDLDLRLTSTCNLSAHNVSEDCVDRDGVIAVSTHEQIEDMLHALVDKHPLSKVLYDIVCSFGKAGASISAIQAKFEDQNQYKEPLLFFDTLESLQSHNPPLICIIGFEHLRYVASEFISNWFIKQNSVRYILPLMWYDTTGTIIPDALEGCANAIMSHILKKPGISFAALRDTFQGFYTNFELYHILRYLLGSKRIMSRTIQRAARPKRVSVFDKRPLVSIATTDHTLNNDKITCYWLARDYYL
ncbi:hypothetical protein MAM1_0235d08497 [Mucor ambiguus]|uniref:Uncharacterized protein n=1 Tax=Mucor ambiguus TaxID=91626 RepID=A0A0C9MZD4_9FUNG|nr:hypothetical protein MAM1_0235d08497 [Mucor ambiguus]